MAVNVGKGVFAVIFILFGVVWISTCLTMPSGGGSLFAVFGLLVIAMGLYSLLRGPRAKAGFGTGAMDRHDPADLPESRFQPPRQDGVANGFCPYCGSPLESDFQYCGVCGRRLRWRRLGGSPGYA